MRSNRSKNQFFEQMKKKPDLQKILDNIENYTESDIDKISQPKWIKEQLKLRVNSSNIKALSPIEIADLMTKKSVKKVRHVNVYEYKGEDTYIGNEMEVRNNDLIAEENGKLLVGGKKYDKSSLNSIYKYKDNVRYEDFVSMKNERLWQAEFPHENRIEDKVEDSDLVKDHGLFQIRRI